MDTKIYMTILPKQNCTVSIEIYFPLDLVFRKQMKGKQELRVQKEFIDDDG